MDTLIAAVIGLGSGLASGAFGIGGALLSTPGIRWILGTAPLVAVGTTLPVIIPTAITGVHTYHRAGFIDVRNAVTAALAGGSFAVLGALTTTAIPGELLLVITAVFIFALSLRMLREPRQGTEPLLSPTIPVFLVIGAASGFVSGLLGIGGGVVLVPVLTVLLNFPVKTALGTSLAIIAAQAIPGTITHALLGNIDWAIAGGLFIGVIPGARVGSRIAVKAQDRTLRIAVGLAMAGLAVAFGITELRALLG